MMRRYLAISSCAAVVLFAAQAGERVAVLQRLTPAEIAQLEQGGAGIGTSGVVGIRTTILSGDPAQAGLYTIRLSVPANTHIRAHVHRDNRSATVVSGTWRIGYGKRFDEGALKTLPPGSFYTEPASEAHFAQTGPEPVVVYITGEGPTDTQYVE